MKQCSTEKCKGCAHIIAVGLRGLTSIILLVVVLAMLSPRSYHTAKDADGKTFTHQKEAEIKKSIDLVGSVEKWGQMGASLVAAALTFEILALIGIFALLALVVFKLQYGFERPFIVELFILVVVFVLLFFAGLIGVILGADCKQNEGKEDNDYIYASLKKMTCETNVKPWLAAGSLSLIAILFVIADIIIIAWCGKLVPKKLLPPKMRGGAKDEHTPEETTKLQVEGVDVQDPASDKPEDKPAEA